MRLAMRFSRRPRIQTGAAVIACLGWSLTLTGCHQHPLAQRSAGEWRSSRVLIDHAHHPDARVRPVSKGGFYALVREWDQAGHVAADARGPGELAQAYLDRGQLLGFRRTAEDQVVAIFGSQSIVLRIDPGVHHVWYREQGHWSDPEHTTFWLGALGIAALVGLVFLVAQSDDSSVNINVN